MINAPTSTFVHTESDTSLAPHRIRAGGRFFWAVFAAEALLIAAALALVVTLVLPAGPPLTQSGDSAVVRQAILDRLQGITDDPLIDVAPGVTARSSNVRGFTLNKVTYYYYVEGSENFDPLSRAVIGRHEVDVVFRDTESPVPLTIYTIVSK
jgi:hypothetical protein